MITIILETAAGELVHRGEILIFNSQPDLLLWGSRYFKFHQVNLQAVSMTYREAFVFALMPTWATGHGP